uniref:Uncharacterized protein n=1 Tax=Avena sativa TaxID=4498 RepID=A0ACD5VTF4_AVESA
MTSLLPCMSSARTAKCNIFLVTMCLVACTSFVLIPLHSSRFMHASIGRNLYICKPIWGSVIFILLASGVGKDGLIRHFFHRPSKAYTTGTRKRRKVHTDEQGGETRWHKTGKTRPVFTDGKLKGYKKILVLYTNYGKQRKPEKTNWVMHQYHLGSDEEEKDGELVVSKVFYQTQPRQCGGSTAAAAAAALAAGNIIKGGGGGGATDHHRHHHEGGNNSSMLKEAAGMVDFYSPAAAAALIGYSSQAAPPNNRVAAAAAASAHLMPNFEVHTGGTGFGP